MGYGTSLEDFPNEDDFNDMRKGPSYRTLPARPENRVIVMREPARQPVKVYADPAVHLSGAFDSRGVAGDPDGAQGRAVLFLVRGFLFLAVFFVMTLAILALVAGFGLLPWTLDLGFWAFSIAGGGTLLTLLILVALDYRHSPAGVERYRIQRAGELAEEQVRLQAELYAQAIEGQLELLKGRDR